MSKVYPSAAAALADVAKDGQMIAVGRYDVVALGVYPDNVGAIRLYRRLGFTAAERRTSVTLA